MIQIRKRSGEAVAVESAAVEFVDSRGRLAAVITQSAGGIVNILTPGDPVFNAYARVNDMRASKVTIHTPTSNKGVLI